MFVCLYFLLQRLNTVRNTDRKKNKTKHRIRNGGKRVSPRCTAAMLTFLYGTSADANRNSASSLRSSATTPTQGPVLTSKTKCRTCWSHMTPLYSQNRLMHKYAVKNDPIYPTTKHRIPLLPKHPHHCAYIVVRSQIRRVSVWEKWRPFCESLRRKKEGRLRSFKNLKIKPKCVSP